MPHAEYIMNGMNYNFLILVLVAGAHYTFEFFPDRVEQNILQYENAVVVKHDNAGIVFTHEKTAYTWTANRHLFKEKTDLGSYLICTAKKAAVIVFPADSTAQ